MSKKSPKSRATVVRNRCYKLQLSFHNRFRYSRSEINIQVDKIISLQSEGSKEEDILGPDGNIRGWLQKRGRAVVGGGILHDLTWKKRWFTQQGTRLFYLKERGAAKPKGYINLLEISAVETITDPLSGFRLHTKDRIFLLKASSPRDRDRWAELLKERCPKIVSAIPLDRNTISEGQFQAAVDGAKSVFSIPSQAIKILHQLGKVSFHSLGLELDDLIQKSFFFQGSFGTVHLGIWEGSFYAVKMLDSELGATRIDSFVREAQLAFSITPHNCVARLYGMCIEVSKYALVMVCIILNC